MRYDAVNATLLNEFLKEHRKVEKSTKDFRATVAQQQKQIEALTAGLQKVSDQLELNKPAPRTVVNDQQEFRKNWPEDSRARLFFSSYRDDLVAEEERESINHDTESFCSSF